MLKVFGVFVFGRGRGFMVITLTGSNLIAAISNPLPSPNVASDPTIVAVGLDR